jgi:hypothetical protein
LHARPGLGIAPSPDDLGLPTRSRIDFPSQTGH